MSDGAGGDAADSRSRGERDQGQDRHRARLEALISKLPQKKLRRTVRWLLGPKGRFVRIPAGILFVLGGIFSILPVLGIWMLPLGIILLAEDLPPLRWAVDRCMDWIDRRWPKVFEQNEEGAA